MKVVYSSQHLKHNPQFEYLIGEKVEHFEKSERIENIKQELEKHPEFQFIQPISFSEDHIERFHNKDYIYFLKNNKTTEIIFNKFCEDTFTFFDENVYTNAKNAVDVALTGVKLLLVLEKAITKLNEFHPDFTIILFGYDTYKEDPIAGLNLSIESYNHIGKKISAINSPLLILQEGGYVIDKAGEIVYSFLLGVENYG